MDISLHYTKTGSGFPLLLLHGNGEDSTYFEHQVPVFSKRFTVYAIDTRGHGQSPMGTAPFALSQFADDLLAFMDEHDLPQADILGFSDGGNIALIFALRYPDRVRRLVLNAANLHPTGIKTRYLTEMQREREAVDESTAEGRYQAQLLDLMLLEPNLTSKDLWAITCPTLVIAGRYDVIVENHTRLMALAIPGAKLAIIPGEHDCAFRNPADFNAAVERFFEETQEEPL